MKKTGTQDPGVKNRRKRRADFHARVDEATVEGDQRLDNARYKSRGHVPRELLPYLSSNPELPDRFEQRLRELKHVSKLARVWTDEVIATWVYYMFNASDEALRVHCGKLLMDRGWGLPMQGLIMANSIQDEQRPQGEVIVVDAQPVKPDSEAMQATALHIGRELYRLGAISTMPEGNGHGATP